MNRAIDVAVHLSQDFGGHIEIAVALTGVHGMLPSHEDEVGQRVQVVSK